MTDKRSKPPLTKAEKQKLWHIAQTQESYKTLATVADDKLATGRTQAITVEQREALLVRIIGGEFLGSACAALGIKAGNVRQLAYQNDEFGSRLSQAYSHGMYALAEELLDIPYDDNLSDAAKRLKSDNIKWLASRLNRNVFGDNVKVEHTHRVEPIVLPIEAVIIDADEDGL